jgi:hypothetical protein
MDNKKLELKIKNQQNQISELYVLIDTLQTNLRSAVSEISPMDRKKITNVQSYKWCMNWRSGDEKT